MSLLELIILVTAAVCSLVAAVFAVWLWSRITVEEELVRLQDDVRQLPREGTQFARGRNDGAPEFVELTELGFEFVVPGAR